MTKHSFKALAFVVLSVLFITACSGGADRSSSDTSVTTPRYFIAPETRSSGLVVNGVDIINGNLAYPESDLATRQLSFVRQYSSSGLAPANFGGWQHEYNNALDASSRAPYSSLQGAKSAQYVSVEQACQAGWESLKNTAYNGQLQAAMAVFKAGLCELSLDNTVVASLPVQDSEGENTYPVHILTRADGSRITFVQQADKWVTTTREPYQLTASGTDWIVTLPDDSSEHYNAAGQLSSITDATGQTTTLSYNASGDLAQVTSPFGETLILSYTNGQLQSVSSEAGSATYTYDNDGKLASVTLPDDSTRTYYYTDGKLTSIADAEGTVIAQYRYDAEGRVTDMEGAAGTEVKQLSYQNKATQITDVENSVTDTYEYGVIHGLPKITRITDSEGGVQSFEYNKAGYITKSTDKNGLVTLTDYNDRNLPESITEAVGTEEARTTLIEWHAQFRKPVRTIESDKITEFEYDAQGRVISTSEGEPEASSTVTTASATLKPAKFSLGKLFRKHSWQYNLFGLLKQNIAPNGAVTRYEYDKKGNRIASTDALGRIRKILALDAAGRPLKTQDANGIITENSYDKAGRLLKTSRNGLELGSAYDRAGRLTKLTYPDGSTTDVSYTAAGKVASIRDAQGNTTRYTYDRNGNRLSTTLTNATGQIEQFYRQTYDKLGRVSQVMDAEGQSTTYAYDSQGNLTQTTDAKGRITRLAYDNRNRLTQMTDAAGGITEYRYDNKGNLTQVKAPNGVVTSYVYDSDNRVTVETNADSGIRTQTYDASGNVISSTDAQGQTTAYTYDLLNRRTKATWADGTEATWTYDTCSNGSGRLCTITDSSGSTYYQYDSQGRVTRKDQVIGMTALTQHYTYSSDGKLQTETLPSGAVIGYSYNQDQLSALSINGQTYLSGLRYNAAQQITRWQWADGSANQQSYDSLNRLQRFQLGKDTRTLSYDAVSNVIGFEDQGTNPQSQRFGYDALDRIISYQAANDAQTFEYDPNGNRTAKRQQNGLIPYLIEANSNRLMGVGNAAQQLDANGNLLNDGKYLYTYNAQNRLANVDGIYRYTYNANQQRVQKTSPQGTTLYAWANGRIIGEYDQSGTAKQETVYMGTTPIATIQQGKVYRIYADQLDTPRVITDEKGKTLWRWDSSPFGETAANEDADGDGIALNYNPRFPGQLYDAETGLHYNYHRDYNPETGRYVQSDPIGLAGGLNTFGYVNQSPYGYVDPDGLIVETAWDLLNMGMGAASFAYNLWSGNWGAAAVDGLGIITDTMAAVIPVIPGGAATAIQAGRAADKLADTVQSIFPKDLGIVGSTQPELYQETLDFMVSSLKKDAAAFWKEMQGTGELIKIWEIKGRRYLYDGNHRFFAAQQAGLPIPMNQIIFERKDQTDIPLFDLKNMDIIK